MKTELLEHISDEKIQAGSKEFVGAVGMTADDFAQVVAFAISQPAHVDINEVLFRPTAQPI
jgi:NADP-dependent 3-hydroxy acid dehydrogenase YdfG